MDVISILKKKKEPVVGLDVIADGTRASEHPKVFTDTERIPTDTTFSFPTISVALLATQACEFFVPKARIVAIGVFDNTKRSVVYPTKHKIKVPIIEKKTARNIYPDPCSLQSDGNITIFFLTERDCPV